MKAASTLKSSTKEARTRHAPLADQILGEGVRAKRRAPKQRDRADDPAGFVEERLTKKILKQARQQQEELEEDDGPKKGRRHLGSVPTLKSTGGDASSDEDEAEAFSDTEDNYFDDVEIDPEEERALEQFMSKNPMRRQTFGDIIMDRIRDKATELASQASEMPGPGAKLDPKVIQVYTSVGEILSRYRSGKLPKAFKIVPALTNWEEILYFTNPDGWSAAAVYQATRIFASCLNAKMAQRFFNLVVLPRIRDDIAEYKRLNFHLYMALKKSLFKPAAFFKGILLPLCESGDCTLREATIVASVIAKSTIPMLHSSAVLLKIAEMEYTGANSIFLRTFFDKKYSLPFRAVDGVVAHFIQFQSDTRVLPVLWHQALLTFVQRYKADISVEQKEALLELIKIHAHPQITPEVRREIVHSRSRDVELPMEGVDTDAQMGVEDDAMES